MAFSGVEREFLRPLEMELSWLGTSRENQRKQLSNTNLHHKGVIFIIANLRILMHCYIKCPFLGLGASFGQFSSNGISFHHELIFAMGLEF